MPRSVTKFVSSALYFTSSVFYLSAAYGDFVTDNITTAQIVAGSLTIVGNLVWMSASILDMCVGCKNKKSKVSFNEIAPDIENQLDELQKRNSHASSTAHIATLLNFNRSSLKKSPSGKHLNLELELEIDDEPEEDKPKDVNVVVLHHVSLEKRIPPEDSTDEKETSVCVQLTRV